MLTDDVAAAVLDSLPSPVAVLSPNGTVLRLNEAWRRSAATGVAVVPVRPGVSWLAACDGLARAAAQNAAPPAGASDADPAAPARALAALSRQMIDRRRSRARIEIPQSTPRGRRWLDVRLRTLIRGDGLIVVVDDVTERHQREDLLRRRAATDPVTGLANRTELRERLAARLIDASTVPRGDTVPASTETGTAQSAATNTPAAPEVTDPPLEEAARSLAVLFLDLDSFHRVNSTFGYSMGDAALRAAARRFSAAIGRGDILGRWGGDEFVVLTDMTSTSDTADLAERLISSLTEPLNVHGHRIPVSVTVGVALSAGAGRRPGSEPGADKRQSSLPPAGSQAAGPGPAPDAVATGDALVEMAGAEVVRLRAHARAAGRERHRPHRA